ncbi:hypothetical protein [Nocardioides alcanivorans]|uniref:hypothetical protein n=1 Tax=Nocardioides alcanivorans TaxID=2897352 RepID=UPI001F216FD8|nr:hypothetical protein [Nocardioides alcanivorans]
MGGGIEVSSAEVIRKGQVVVTTACRIDGLELAGHLNRVGDALPGSLASLAVRRLATTWTQSTATWSEAVRTHGGALLTSGADHEATEVAVKRALQEGAPYDADRRTLAAARCLAMTTVGEVLAWQPALLDDLASQSAGRPSA